MPDLFKSGTLDMSTEPLQYVADTLRWGDVMVNRIAVMVTIILLILELPDLIRLYPQLLRCLSRWKGNLELEHSVSLARTRNNVALVAADIRNRIFICQDISACGRIGTVDLRNRELEALFMVIKGKEVFPVHQRQPPVEVVVDEIHQLTGLIRPCEPEYRFSCGLFLLQMTDLLLYI